MENDGQGSPVAVPRGGRRRTTRIRKSRMTVALLAAAGAMMMMLAGIRLTTADPSATPLARLGLPAAQAPEDTGQPMTSAQCVSCHAPEKVLSHPVGVVPSMTVPLPLDGGTVNCTTCHQDSFAAHLQATTGNPILRGAGTGMSFCNECHTGGSLSSQGQHPHAMAQAHFGWIKGGPAATTPRYDGVNTCLSCHDGTIASDQFGGNDPTKQLTNHSVGVDYHAAFLQPAKAALAPAVTIDHRVMLTNGQVTCMSCHSLFSREAGLLVIRNDNSALCGTCHRE